MSSGPIVWKSFLGGSLRGLAVFSAREARIHLEIYFADECNYCGGCGECFDTLIDTAGTPWNAKGTPESVTAGGSGAEHIKALRPKASIHHWAQHHE